MSESKKPQNFKALADQVTKFAARKEAGGSDTGPEDPTKTSVPAVTKGEDPNDNPSSGVSGQKGNAPKPKDVTDSDTNPKAADGNPATLADGNTKEDAFTTPTTPLAKIANLDKIAQAIQGFSKTPGTKSATAVTAKVDGATPATEAPKGDDAEKNAGDDIYANLTDHFHMKLASEILSSEEGIALAHTYLSKRANAEAADDLINKARAQQEGFCKAAAEEYEYQEQMLAFQKEASDQFNALPPEQQALVKKAGEAHQENLSQISDDLHKLAYMQGAADGGAMMEDPGGMIPGGDPEQPMGPEEIMAVVQAMVESGELTPEEAEQILAELEGGEMGGAPEGGMPGDPAMMGAEGAPPAEAGGAIDDAAIKAASSDVNKTVDALLA